MSAFPKWNVRPKPDGPRNQSPSVPYASVSSRLTTRSTRPWRRVIGALRTVNA
jgi:hypothetical protein